MDMVKAAEKTDWLMWGFRSVSGVLFIVCTFYIGQLNSSIQSLNLSLKSIEAHLTGTDIRITAIETSREALMPRYNKLIDTIDASSRELAALQVRVLELERDRRHPLR